MVKQTTALAIAGIWLGAGILGHNGGPATFFVAVGAVVATYIVALRDTYSN